MAGNHSAIRFTSLALRAENASLVNCFLCVAPIVSLSAKFDSSSQIQPNDTNKLQKPRRGGPLSAQGVANGSGSEHSRNPGFCASRLQQKPQRGGPKTDLQEMSQLIVNVTTVRRFRTTPSGFFACLDFVPRVARHSLPLAFSSPWADIGLYLRHESLPNKDQPYPEGEWRSAIPFRFALHNNKHWFSLKCATSKPTRPVGDDGETNLQVRSKTSIISFRKLLNSNNMLL